MLNIHEIIKHFVKRKEYNSTFSIYKSYSHKFPNENFQVLQKMKLCDEFKIYL